jgi:hypothetical protein
MSDPQQELKSLQEDQKKQADLVRTLKAEKAPKEKIDAAVSELQRLKTVVEKKTREIHPEKVEFPREKFSRLLTQRFFLTPSFEIYGGKCQRPLQSLCIAQESSLSLFPFSFSLKRCCRFFRPRPTSHCTQGKHLEHLETTLCLGREYARSRLHLCDTISSVQVRCMLLHPIFRVLICCFFLQTEHLATLPNSPI